MARFRPSSARREQHARRRPRRLAFLVRLSLACATMWTAQAQAADQVRISRLSDVTFGTIGNFSADYVRAQDICLYSKSPPGNNYRITASGSGAGGGFLLGSGGATLPFEVQWADLPGQTSGTQLVANQPAAAQHSTAGAGDPGDCSKGPITTASLIVILRSATIAAATSGDYTGTLTLLVAPE